jgi:hypothetical protein
MNQEELGIDIHINESDPITICMNNKFSANGPKAFVLEALSEYTLPIYASDY